MWGPGYGVINRHGYKERAARLALQAALGPKGLRPADA